jgi:glycosyltransferase involved in cell wall biosynthesis
MPNSGRLLIVVPCYNEASSLPSLMDELSRALQGDCHDVLVVDDGSSDKTSEVALQYGRCISLPINLGIGGAVQTGLKYAFRHGYQGCIQLDGDGQHPPGEMRKLIAAWQETGANVVIGSRYLEGDGFQSSWARRTGSRLIALCLRALFSGLRVTDPTSGMRLMDRNAVRAFAARYPHDFPEPISIALAARLGMKIREVPVIMRSRSHGNSSISGLKTLAYMLRGLGYILLARFQKTGTSK